MTRIIMDCGLRIAACGLQTAANPQSAICNPQSSYGLMAASISSMRSTGVWPSALHLLHSVQGFKAVNDFAEDRIFAVQVWRRRQHDEERGQRGVRVLCPRH